MGFLGLFLHELAMVLQYIVNKACLAVQHMIFYEPQVLRIA